MRIDEKDKARVACDEGCEMDANRRAGEEDAERTRCGGRYQTRQAKERKRRRRELSTTVPTNGHISQHEWTGLALTFWIAFLPHAVKHDSALSALKKCCDAHSLRLKNRWKCSCTHSIRMTQLRKRLQSMFMQYGWTSNRYLTKAKYDLKPPSWQSLRMLVEKCAHTHQGVHSLGHSVLLRLRKTTCRVPTNKV